MESSHILLLPMPFQGHIMPMMEMAYHLIDKAFTITFVNTDFNHRRLLAAATSGDSRTSFSATTNRLHLIGISDGMSSDEERKDVGLICRLISQAMSTGLESIIRGAAAEGRPIQWIIADQNMAWAFPLAKRMGLRAAIFWPASAAMLAIMLNIPKLIETGVINEQGLQKKDEIFQLAVGMPAVSSTQLAWNMAGNSADKSAIFSFVLTNNRATTEHAEFIIFNSFMDLEPEAISLIHSAIPIGPLLSAEHHPMGHLWPPANSADILKWLDNQSLGSVLYVAFGSFAIFDKTQLDELAHGLEMTGRPFLWAVRPDLSTDGLDEVFSSEFLSRVKHRALLVGWAPQQQVLAHPSIGCFMSHCGWNSTLEGVCNGVRFLCWPYFTDQFLNQSYICDMWGIGLRMGPNEDGLGELEGCKMAFIKRENIKERVEEVMKNDEIKEKALVWKERALKTLNVSGSSYENYKRIVDIMKGST